MAINAFPLSQLRFRHPWRSYQATALGALDDHLVDRRAHVVAPPGAGKTSLGLEIVHRLGRPTLILVPTIALRGQWIARLCTDFLDGAARPDWISTDLEAPALLTVATYQAAYQLFSRKWDDGVAASAWGSLDALRGGTLVLDEAHHLKRAWWDALDDLAEQLDPTIVALTATPPYDVSAREWARYRELNGPIDAEITVPELVASGELAVHQDLLYLVEPHPGEAAALRERHEGIDALLDRLLADGALAEALLAWPPFADPEAFPDAAAEAVEGIAATTVFLHAAGREVPRETTDWLGVSVLTAGVLDYGWTERFLSFHLAETDLLDAYRDTLRRLHVLRGDRVDLRQRSAFLKQLARGGQRLGAIGEIAVAELASRGADLRLVVLTDHIQRAWLGRAPEATTPLGTVPAFERLRGRLPAATRLAVLTGSLVIVPLELFDDGSTDETLAGLTPKPLPHAPAYAELAVTDQLRPGIVAALTALFSAGKLHVLVGTRALLGEGWDAPAANVLVIASAVSSFVTSNQLRGRVLRQRPGKVANLWHLACVDPSAPDGGVDLDRVRRRFHTFLGPTHTGPPQLTDGLERLDLPAVTLSTAAVANYNRTSLVRSEERERVRERWNRALRAGTEVVPSLRIESGGHPDWRSPTQLKPRRTRVASNAALAVGLVLAAIQLRRLYFNLADEDASDVSLGAFALLLLGCFLIYAGRQLRELYNLDAARRRRRRVQVKAARATLTGLRKTGLLGEGRGRPVKTLEIDVHPHGETMEFALYGGTRHSRERLTEALLELFSVPDRPRYLLRWRGSGWLGRWGGYAYAVVPEALGRSAKEAEVFRGEWRRRVGPADLIYTRTLEGRVALGTARVQAMGDAVEVVRRVGGVS